MINYWARSGALNEGRVFDFRECNASYYPINGVQTGVSPGETFKYIQPDLNGRPWADIWEREFEKDMAAKPKAADVLSGF
jgi:hypothetical protein